MVKSSSPRSLHASTPTRLGYRMPPEWSRHAATWLSWPHNQDTWLCGLEPIESFFCDLIAEIVTDEDVHVNVNDAAMEARVRALLADRGLTGPVYFHLIATNDAWCRDHGATIVTRQDIGSMYPAHVAVDWGYNAWGGKYPPFDRDNEVAGAMARALGLPRAAGGMILEGGSIDVNGCGDLLTSEACLLNKNRNPLLTRELIEQRLCEMLGVTNVLWLGDGIVGDDTDGHIDDVTRFVGEDKVVTVVEQDPADENYAVLQENLKRLQSMRLADGRPLHIIHLPMPRPVLFGTRRLPASYANFYFTNHKVLVPLFNQPADELALATLAEHLPGRTIVGLPCVDMVSGLGAIHCVTQQIPAIATDLGAS